MHAAVDQFFQQDVPQLTLELAEFEKSIEPLAYPDNDERLSELERILSRGLSACRGLDKVIGDDPELLKAAQCRFQEATAPWLNQSWIIHRARTKPRGFPGDYQMLSAIYDGVPIARGMGGYLDRLCLKMTLGKAVAARLKDAQAFLNRELTYRSGTVRVLDVACGPGREFRSHFDRPSNAEVVVTCVDSDEGALEYIRRHVSKHAPAPVSFRFMRHNALRMRSADAIIERFGRNDIIYSVGLADYIPDKHLVPMLRGWREAVNPGGTVYVAFKDARRYDRAEYQWLMNWHFLQRDETDCLRLLDQAGYDEISLETHRDESGVVLTYAAHQKPYASVRFDHAARQSLIPIRSNSDSGPQTPSGLPLK